MADSKNTCIKRGGTWDEATQTCSVAPPKDVLVDLAKLKTDKKAERKVGIRDTPEDIASAEEIGQAAQLDQDRKAAATSIQGAQPQQEPVQEPTPEIPVGKQGFFKNVGAFLEGRPLNIGGKVIQTGLRGTTEQEAAGQTPEVLGGSLPIGINPALIAQAGAMGLDGIEAINGATTITKVAGTSRAAGTNLRALGTNPRALGTNPRAVATGILQAPSRVRAGVSALKISAYSVLGFVGLGSVKSVTTNLLTSDVKRIEAEVSKVGEQLTKIPETSSLGFSLDEDGQLYEYTPSMALADISEVEQSLNDAEVALKEASIGHVILKITGRYNTAQAEIDKQRKEITVAKAKVLNQIANPSDNLLNSRNFFRGLEFMP